ncbi:MAG TPA: hypothetical protein VFZ48_04915 [Candidatus Saccharimonadales bacterium]
MTTRSVKRPRRRFNPVAAVLALAGIALVALVWIVASIDGPSTNALGGTNQTKPPTTTTTTPPRTDCPTGPARFEPGDNFQIIKDGLPRDNPENAKKAAIEAAKTNPVFVAGVAVERGFNGGAYIDASTLTKDGCWTAEGHTLSIKVQGAIEAAKAEFGITDRNKRNSGAENGKLVVSETPGIDGDQSVLRLTHSDGSVTEILLRCGNVLVEGEVPHIPRGRTDNTPPPTYTPPGTTQPPYECPPGHVGTPPNCRESKIDAQQPQNRGNVPIQVQPGGQQLTVAPTHAQPQEPVNPPPTYQSPTQTQAPTSPRPTPPPSNTVNPTGPPATGDPCVVNPSNPACGGD